MSEDVAGSPPHERPRWLDVAVTVLPPVGLINALLVYFSWVRRVAFAEALGLNVDLMAESSILGYVLRSTAVVFFPLLVANIGLLLCLWVDRMLRRWVRDGVHLKAVFRASWGLSVGAAMIVLGAMLVAMVWPVAKPYVHVVMPFVVVLAVLAVAYGASLRRLVAGKGGDQCSVGRRWAVNALIGLLVSLLLFAGMDNFAHVVGYGLAAGIIKQPERYTYPVLLYSKQDLQLDPATAVRQELSGGEHAAYQYRYQGLRLAFVDGGRYFLIGRNWQPSNGTMIVLSPDGLRIEFPRGTR
ncbi:MAG: hypothetical protein ACRDSH_18280 [Pseudonocardiaceae bacterium]